MPIVAVVTPVTKPAENANPKSSSKPLNSVLPVKTAPCRVAPVETVAHVNLCPAVTVVFNLAMPTVAAHRVRPARRSTVKISVFQTKAFVLPGSVRPTRTVAPVKAVKADNANPLRSLLPQLSAKNATPTLIVVAENVAPSRKENTVHKPATTVFSVRMVTSAPMSPAANNVCPPAGSAPVRPTRIVTTALPVPVVAVFVKVVASMAMSAIAAVPVHKDTSVCNRATVPQPAIKPAPAHIPTVHPALPANLVVVVNLVAAAMVFRE